MADFGRWNPQEGEPGLHDIHRSEEFLDALATGRPIYAGDPGEDELAYLMAGWRDGVRNTPARSTITEQDAVAALQRGLTGPQRGRTGPRRGGPSRGGPPKLGRRISLSVVGSAAAAVLCLGGFGAIVAGAGPGDALYGLRTMFFGEAVRDDPVVLAAQTELAEVEQLIAQGDWTAAQQRLQAVTTTVATVDDQVRKEELVAEWQQLSVKVESRDPEATVPPDAPPVTLPVLPPDSDLVTTTVPSEPGTSPSEPTEPGADPTEPTEPGADPTEPGADLTEPGTDPTDVTDPTGPAEPGTDPTEPGELDATTAPTEPDTVEPTAGPTSSPDAPSPSPSPPVTTTVSPPETSAPAPTTTPAPTSAPRATSAPATTTVTSAAREPAAGGGTGAGGTDTGQAATPEARATVPTAEAEASAVPAQPATTTTVPMPTGDAAEAG